MPVSVRSFRADEWDLYRALRLEALRDAPNAFGSTLAREEAFADQEWITRLERGVALAPESAIDFYRRVGFEVVGECSPLRPGSNALQHGMRRGV